MGEINIYLHGWFVNCCSECYCLAIVSTLNINNNIHQSKGNYCDECIKSVLLKQYKELFLPIKYTETCIKYIWWLSIFNDWDLNIKFIIFKYLIMIINDEVMNFRINKLIYDRVLQLIND